MLTAQTSMASYDGSHTGLGNKKYKIKQKYLMKSLYKMERSNYTLNIKAVSKNDVKEREIFLCQLLKLE